MEVRSFPPRGQHAVEKTRRSALSEGQIQRIHGLSATGNASAYSIRWQSTHAEDHATRQVIPQYLISRGSPLPHCKYAFFHFDLHHVVFTPLESVQASIHYARSNMGSDKSHGMAFISWRIFRGGLWGTLVWWLRWVASWGLVP